MTVVTVSPKFQIVIPKETRIRHKIKTGTRIAVLEYGNTISLVPIVPLSSLKGTLKGKITPFIREPDREI